MICKYRDNIENDEVDFTSEYIFERQPIIGISIPGEKELNTTTIPPIESCLINIYDEDEEKRPLRLQDMIEVIGICRSFSSTTQPSSSSSQIKTEFYEIDPDFQTTTDFEIDEENMNHNNIDNNNISEEKSEHSRKKQKLEMKSNDSTHHNSHLSKDSINLDFLQEFSTEEIELLFSQISTPYSLPLKQTIPSYQSPLKYQIDCLFYQRIESSYPLYSSICDVQTISNELIETYSIPHSNDEILSFIPHLFNTILNDSLVSQYLTYSILSHVYNRVDLLNPVGNLPLNIFNFPSYDSLQYKLVIETIRNIVPRVVEVFLFFIIIFLISFISFPPSYYVDYFG